jgi:hypothetical protein
VAGEMPLAQGEAERAPDESRADDGDLLEGHGESSSVVRR